MSASQESLMERLQLPPLWARILLGLVLIAAGVLVLADVVLATLISTILIGLTILLAGLFEVFHAVWRKGWGGLVWHVLLGFAYTIIGLILVTQPSGGALVLTWVLGVVLAVSGLSRVYLGVRNWAESGWLLMMPGMFGFIAGVIVLLGWPMTGLWVIGLLLGLDLVLHGVGWLVLAWRPVPPHAALRHGFSRM